MMLVHGFLEKYSDIVPESVSLIILHIKSDMCMANNGMNINNNRHISRRVLFLRNGKNCKMYKI